MVEVSGGERGQREASLQFAPTAASTIQKAAFALQSQKGPSASIQQDVSAKKKTRQQKDVPAKDVSTTMQPTTPHRAGAVPPPQDLFSPSVTVQESPSSVSSLSASGMYPSHAAVAALPHPGWGVRFRQQRRVLSGCSDANYIPVYGSAAANYLTYPDPSTAAEQSVPAIETLTDEPETDFNFTDYADGSGQTSYIEYEEEEQVGGGRYDLRHNVTPSPNSGCIGLRAQQWRREAYAVQDEADDSLSAVVPIPTTRLPNKVALYDSAATAASRPYERPPVHTPAIPTTERPAAHAPAAPAQHPNKVALYDSAAAAASCPYERRPRTRPRNAARRRWCPPPQKSCALRQCCRRSLLHKPHRCSPSQKGRLPWALGRRSRTQCVEGSGRVPVDAAAAARSDELEGAGAAEEAGAIGDTGASAACGRAGPHRPNADAGILPAAIGNARSNAGTDYTPIPPEDFQGTLPEFLSQAGFASKEMPPSPPDWQSSRRCTPLPQDDLPAMSEVECDQQPNLLVWRDAEENQDEDEPEPVDNDDVALTGGQPSRAVSYSAVLKMFYQEEHSGLRPGKNTWNLYQRFANYDDMNRLREHRRLNPFYASASPVPALKAGELSRTYEVFVESQGGEEKANETLSIFFQLGGTSDDTIQARNRCFKAASKAYEKMNDRYHVDDFFTCTILVGGHMNEDEKLAEVIDVPRMAEALFNGLAMNEDEVIGIAKTAAVTLLIKEQVKMRRDLKSTPSGYAATSSPPLRHVVHSSTATTSRPATAAAPTPKSNVRPDSHTTPNAPEPTKTATAAAATTLPQQIPMLHRDGTKTSTTMYACEIHDDTRDVQDVRRVMSMALIEDLGEDVFKNKNSFSWTVMVQFLHEKGHRIINFPSNVCLPSEAPPTKGSGSWSHRERRWLHMSLAARSTPGQGLRFQRVVYPPGDSNFVVVLHNYMLLPLTAYNLADPTTLVRPPLTTNEISKGKKKKIDTTRKKRKAGEDEEHSESDELEPEEEEVGGSAATHSPSPVSIPHVKRVKKEFPKTPPHAGRTEAPSQGGVHFISNNDSDNKSIAHSRAKPKPARCDDTEGAPARCNDNRPMPRPTRRDGTPPTEDAPASRRPPRKHGLSSSSDDAPAYRPPPRKHSRSSDNDNDEYGTPDSVANPADIPQRQTRASKAAVKPAAKPAAKAVLTKKKAKPNASEFDGVELVLPPKRVMPNAAAGPSHLPAPPAAPPAAAPAASFRLPPELAAMDPMQVEALLCAAATIFKGGTLSLQYTCGCMLQMVQKELKAVTPVPLEPLEEAPTTSINSMNAGASLAPYLLVLGMHKIGFLEIDKLMPAIKGKWRIGSDVNGCILVQEVFVPIPLVPQRRGSLGQLGDERDRREGKNQWFSFATAPEELRYGDSLKIRGTLGFDLYVQSLIWPSTAPPLTSSVTYLPERPIFIATDTQILFAGLPASEDHSVAVTSKKFRKWAAEQALKHD
ncbi:hypothetical protein DFH07DRAFT_779758 [Mycena maculata]|uniref:Uncharacterized protein n=1 Tax=Mycena maculata TaxID=230809 RepID=A0AAD7I6G8_9AGAR|nr:hypothetical protein DFH07DRAFT_779758 [Mycena maculata]